MIKQCEHDSLSILAVSTKSRRSQAEISANESKLCARILLAKRTSHSPSQLHIIMMDNVLLSTMNNKLFAEKKRAAYRKKTSGYKFKHMALFQTANLYLTPISLVIMSNTAENLMVRRKPVFSNGGIEILKRITYAAINPHWTWNLWDYGCRWR